MRPVARRSNITIVVFWVLFALALIAYGCTKSDVPKTAESDTVDAPVEWYPVANGLDFESSSDYHDFDYEDSISVPSGDDGDDSTEEEADSIIEEVELQSENSPEFYEEPTLGSTEQQVAETAFEPIAPDTSEPYHSGEVASDVSENREALTLDDRTQGNVVRLVVNSVTLNDCVMRGEIHNYSVDSYARDVTVTFGALDEKESVEWHWPLTMEPGESAPFEVKIGWFPHTYDDGNPDADIRYSLNINHWNWFGNTYVDVEADLSSTPDLRRAFEFNSDDTEFEVLWQNPSHIFLVYDERALELEVSRDWSRYGGQYSVISKPLFAFALPGDVLKSNDFEPMVSDFILYKYVDIFYVPFRLYPDVYEEGVDGTVTDVRVYQAYRNGSKVVDVLELIPHSVVEQVDPQGLLTDRRLIPVSDFVNFDMSDGENVYVQLLSPHAHPENFPFRNVEGEASTHRIELAYLPYELWMGGVSHSGVSSTVDPLEAPTSSRSDSCYASGSLSVGDFYLQGQMAMQEVYTLGNAGVFSSFEIDAKLNESISVDHNSITLYDQEIRGLIHNVSEKSFARDVTVTATRRDSGIPIGTWRWPLSVQPGERAPFEIPYSESDLGVEQIEIQVSATLSEQVDPTRSFLITIYSGGTVYGEDFSDLYEYRPFDSPYPMHYEIRPGEVLGFGAIHSTPEIRYTKEEFLDLYEGVVLPEDVDGLELFGFRDMYARLEPPDSHPELAKVVTTQFIDDLRAYAAILDDDMKVVDIIELPTFTPIYGQANVKQPYVEVNTIPTPNRWSPNAVRLLRIIPYADEADMNKGYYYQVWIGGASCSAHRGC